MKRGFRWIGSMALIAFFLQPGCTTSEEVQFVLNVQCDAGVQGAPQSGAFSYRMDETVPYSYLPSTGYKNLQVTLDGQAAAGSGSIQMDRDHLLSARGARILYLQGNWSVAVVWDSNGCNLGNEANTPCVGTQSGDDWSFSTRLPEGDLRMDGKIDLEGNFTGAGTSDLGLGRIRKYRCQGKMNQENEFLGALVCEFFLNNNLRCTSTAVFFGRRT